MLKDIHAEARELARTDAQKSTTRIIAQLAADAALAIDPNTPADDQPVQSFIEKNMQ